MLNGYANTIAYCLYPARSKRSAPGRGLRNDPPHQHHAERFSGPCSIWTIILDEVTALWSDKNQSRVQASPCRSLPTRAAPPRVRCELSIGQARTEPHQDRSLIAEDRR